MRKTDKDKDNSRVLYTAIAAVIPNDTERATISNLRQKQSDWKKSSLMGLVCSYDSQIHLNRVDLIEVYPYASTKTEQAGKANNGSTTGEPSDNDRAQEPLELKASIKFPFHGGCLISDIKVIKLSPNRQLANFSKIAVISGTNGGLFVVGIRICTASAVNFDLRLIQAIKIPNSEKPLILWFPPDETELNTFIPVLVFSSKSVRTLKIQ